MRYDPTGNNLSDALRTSQPLRRILNRKAQAAAEYWTANSIIRTGFNASSVAVLEGIGGADRDRMVAVVYAHGYYAKWRELGTRYNRAERVLRTAAAGLRDA